SVPYQWWLVRPRARVIGSALARQTLNDRRGSQILRFLRWGRRVRVRFRTDTRLRHRERLIRPDLRKQLVGDRLHRGNLALVDSTLPVRGRVLHKYDPFE